MSVREKSNVILLNYTSQGSQLQYLIVLQGEICGDNFFFCLELSESWEIASAQWVENLFKYT